MGVVLPSPRRSHASALIGRRGELAALAGHVDSGTPLVTIVGPPGTGKTRLAWELLAQLEESGAFEQDVSLWFADASPCATPEQLCLTVAGTLGLPAETQQRGDQLGDDVGRGLAAAGRAVLVLDNLEQLLPAVRPVLASWLRLAPDTTLLATSRVALGLPQEEVLELKNLGLPPEGAVGVEGLLESDAAGLFLARAEQSVGALDAAASAEQVAEIVRQLDGNPLAIELAAGRLELLSLEALSRGLADRFTLLRDPTGVLPERHQSLRRALEWSWQLLTSAERATLAQVSVFAGGFRLEAAEAVLGVADMDVSASVLDLLQLLCRKHLLRAERSGPGGDVRLYCDESIRAFAAEHLANRGETEATEARHARHYVATALAWAERAESNEDPEAIGLLETESHNLIAAAERALRAGPVTSESLHAALGAVVALAPLLAVRAQALFTGLLEPALVLARSHATEANERSLAALLTWQANLLYRRGDHDAVEQLVREARDLAQPLGDVLREAVATRYLGVLAWAHGQHGEARPLCEQALALFERCGSRVGMARCLSMIGGMLTELGQPSEGEARLRQALALVEPLPAPRARADVTHYLAQNLLEQRQNEEALALLARNLERRRALGHASGEALEVYLSGVAEHDQGHLERARTAYDTAVVLLERLQEWWLLAYVRRLRALVDLEAGALDAAETAITASLPGDVMRRADYVAFFRAALACSQVLRGERVAARETLGEVRELLTELAADDLQLVPEIVEGLLELADGQHDPEAGTFARAHERLDRVATVPTVQVRLMARVLASRLAELEDDRDAFRAAGDGSWFQVSGADAVSLAKKPLLARLVGALVQRRLAEPGESLDRSTLVAAGWPDEQIRGPSAANRLYVALNTLRGLGLEGLLQHTREGYRLDPDVPLRLGTDE